MMRRMRQSQWLAENQKVVPTRLLFFDDRQCPFVGYCDDAVRPAFASRSRRARPAYEFTARSQVFSATQSAAVWLFSSLLFLPLSRDIVVGSQEQSLRAQRMGIQGV